VLIEITSPLCVILYTSRKESVTLRCLKSKYIPTQTGKVTALFYI
jgi:hypothetical protein